MTLTEFQNAVASSRTARNEIARLEAEMTTALNNRDTTDEENLKRASLIVNGVVGDPAFGPDSSLYEAMGYERKPERKSGLTRGKKTTTKND